MYGWDESVGVSKNTSVRGPATGRPHTTLRLSPISYGCVGLLGLTGRSSVAIAVVGFAGRQGNNVQAGVYAGELREFR